MKPIIAIFGGSGLKGQDAKTARDAAVALGQRIVASGGIVLSAGTEAHGDAVKNGAIDGAGASWIGVSPDAESSGRVCATQKDGGIVLWTNLGHARNRLEAELCHGAICLTGERGTLSEAVFALALGKPVALWGFRPMAELPHGLVANSLEELAKAACERIAYRPGHGEFTQPLTPATIVANLQARMAYAIFSAATRPKAALEWVKSEVTSHSIEAPLMPEFKDSTRLQLEFGQWWNAKGS